MTTSHEAQNNNAVTGDDLIFLAVRLAGEAVAALMRGGSTVAAIAIEPDPNNSGGFVGDTLIASRAADHQWLAFARLWAPARLHCLLHDDRDLDHMDCEARKQYACLLMQRELNDFDEGADRALSCLDIGFWTLELENAWTAVMDVTERLLASVRSSAEPPTGDEIQELLDAQDDNRR